ncbi:hypothetical protein GOODEAATRI_017205, partial [Goodea atripinnis]
VAVVDLNEILGEQCKAQLDAEFGEGKSTFIQCDVTHGDALRGDDTYQFSHLRFPPEAVYTATSVSWHQEINNTPGLCNGAPCAKHLLIICLHSCRVSTTHINLEGRRDS